MKKGVFLGIAIILVMIGLNLYYYFDTYRWQVNHQSKLMDREMELCVGHISDFFEKTSINIQMAASPQELNCLLGTHCNATKQSCSIRKLALLYGPNLRSLTISNPKGHYFKSFRKSNVSLISEYGEGEPENFFRPAVLFSNDNKTIEYLQPLVEEGDVYGYARMEIDAHGYFSTVLQHFIHDAHSYQYVLLPNGRVAYQQGATKNIEAVFSPELFNNMENSHSLVHTIFVDGKETKVLSVIRRMEINKSTYYLVFSTSHRDFTYIVWRNSFIVGIVTLAILILLIIGVIYSRYQRQKREARNIKSQETLKRMLYYLPVGVVLTDEHNVVAQVNKAAVNLFGTTSNEELIGCVYDDNLWFENRKIISKSRMSINSVRYSIATDSGKVLDVFSERIPFFIDNKCHNINVFIESSNLDGICSNDAADNAAITEAFMANISHELRTPLNGIIGMTDILKKMKLGCEELDILRIIGSSADSLLSLINDVLDFSHVNKGRFFVEAVPFNLKKEIEDIVDSFKFIARQKNINLRWYSSVELPTDFVGDPLRFRQVLNNLINNALKFTQVGDVVIHITSGKIFNGSEGLRFEVHDSGIGIGPEKLKSVFDPFWQADSSSTRLHSGAGLGSTISRQLVEAMGGRIEVHSPSLINNGSCFPGTSFVFTLPLITLTHSKLYDRTRVKCVADITVAIVTDAESEVRQLVNTLKLYSVRYVILDPSANSLIRLRSGKDINAVIIDHRIDFDGLAFLQALHNEKLDMLYPILIQSSDIPSANVGIVKRLGVDSYLRKPVKANLIRRFFVSHFDIEMPVVENSFMVSGNMVTSTDFGCGNPKCYSVD